MKLDKLVVAFLAPVALRECFPSVEKSKNLRVLRPLMPFCDFRFEKKHT